MMRGDATDVAPLKIDFLLFCRQKSNKKPLGVLMRLMR